MRGTEDITLIGDVKPIGMVPALLLFFVPGVAFYLNIGVLVPFLNRTLALTPFVVWLVTGTLLLFAPLFALVFVLLKLDGYRLDWATVKARLNLRRIEWSDVGWVVGGLAVSAVASGLIVLCWKVLDPMLSLQELKSVSPIEVSALTGHDRLWIVGLPVFYFFNYFGEELLWRGYILPRQVLSLGVWAWPVNAVFHGIFHLAFGLRALAPFAPFLLLVPYLVYKRRNTYLAVIVHAILGAPMQFAIAVGLLS